MSNSDLVFWIAFNICVITLLVADLFYFHKKFRVLSTKKPFIILAFWIGLALLFNLLIYVLKGPEAALNFLTGYLIEYSLSIDNLFVFIMIFSYFRVPPHLEHKILFWGVLGAIVMRAFFIFTGLALIKKFFWITYLFGLFLVLTGLKLLFESEKKIDPESNLVINLFKKFFPITDTLHGDRFFVKQEGRLWATPLFLVLIAIETTDLLFAIDSIPAIMAITLDPFIIYTSNIFAILGLRSLFFVVSRMLTLFKYLKYGLGAVLIFIGLKMLVAGIFKIPIGYALGFVVVAIAISVLASIWVQRRT